MTFEKWWDEKIEGGYGEVEMLLREAWSSSAKEEREACAKIAEEFEDDMGYGNAQKIADAIRAL